MDVRYPVVVDNDYAVWQAFDNHYWPALYFADAQGQIRHHHFGEGEYEESEMVLQMLLREAGTDVEQGLSTIEPARRRGGGRLGQPGVAGDATSATNVPSDFASPGGVVPDDRHVYSAPAVLAAQSVVAVRRLADRLRSCPAQRARWFDLVSVPRP